MAPARTRSRARLGWSEAAAFRPTASLTTTRSAHGNQAVVSVATTSSPLTSPTGMPQAPRAIAFRPLSPTGCPLSVERTSRDE